MKVIVFWDAALLTASIISVIIMVINAVKPCETPVSNRLHGAMFHHAGIKH
jgi:hypothetical protein